MRTLGSGYLDANYTAVLNMLANANKQNFGKPGYKPFTPNENNQYVGQSFLCSAIKLSPDISSYSFAMGVNGLSTNTQAQLPEENRLTLQDTMVCFELGYFFNIKKTSGGATKYGSQYFTHPPGQIYSGTNIDTLNSLWDAKGRMQVNNQPVVPYWDMRGHYEAPQTQYPVFQTQSPTALYPVNDEQYGQTSGFRNILPGWVMDGADTNEFLVNFNSSLANIGIAGDMYMILYMRGIMMQNVSRIMQGGIFNPFQGSK